MNCKTELCTKKSRARGFCSTHYSQWHKQGFELNLKKSYRTPLEDRFWKKIEKTNYCWEYVGAKDQHGYGQIWSSEIRKNIKAHRYSFKLHNGYIDESLDICHACDNPSCVNPNHLFLGTAKDNSKDMVKKNRWNNQHKNQTYCKHGHEFTEKNTAYYKKNGKDGMRACIECRKRLWKEYYQRKKNVNR